MIWFIAWTLFLAILVLNHNQLQIQEWIKQILHEKFGLAQVDEFRLSFKRQQPIIYIKGIRICRDNIIKKPATAMPKFILNLPLHFIFARLATFVSIHIDDLILEKDNISIVFDHIYVHSELFEEFAIRVQSGPLRLIANAGSLVEMTTACLVTVSCPVKRFSLKDIKLDIKIGKTVLCMNECIQLFSKRIHTSTNAVRLEDVLNSVRVTVQSICFIFPTLVVEIMNINSVARRDHTPLVQFNSERIKCIILNVEVFRMPSMEIKLSQSDSSTVLLYATPHTDFISLTCILNSPVVNIPLNNVDIMKILFGKNETPSTMVLEKVVADLPICTFALVLNSPRVQLAQVENKCGYISTESLIIRISGEYVVKARNSSVYDVPSSSSSSGSNLDALFAQEEYQWLKKSTTSHQRPSRWLNLMGRVSRRSPNDTVTTTRTQRWSYRVSGKIMLQKFNMGYTESNVEKEFIRIKSAVLIFKIRMNVLLNQLETVFSIDNGIQSEIAINKPVIYLLDNQLVISPSIFWLKHIPSCFKNENSLPAQEKPAWIKTLIRNTSFSLDVTMGSIVAHSLDRSHKDQGVSIPTPHPGYIDNTPLETISSHLVLDTQKFNFVCEGPGSTGTDWKIRCYMEKLDIRQSSRDEKLHVIAWISQLNLSAKLTLLDNLSRCLSVSTKIKKYGICYSVRNHYACLLLAKSLLVMKNQFKPNQEKNESLSLPLYIESDMHVERGDVHIFLPMDAQLYIRLDDFSLNYESTAAPSVTLRNFMLLGVSPADPEAWEQLIEVDKVKLSIKHGIELKARKIFISVPYNYVLSAVLDKVIGAVKAIKELHSRILTRRAFTFFGPTLNNEPILIPCIYIKTRVFTIHFDDDPFEAKLKNILRTGLVEQQKRLAYEDALNEKTNEMLSIEPLDPEVNIQISEARKNLLGYFSEFWIKNINEKKKEEMYFYEQLHMQDYRNVATFQELDESLDEIQRPESDVFIIDVRPRPLYPPLANFSAQFTKISFKPADFSLLETRQFIHTIGGGVPLDNDFSIIIPFHLSIKAGQTWIKMRDYPLPLLYVPPPIDEDISTRASRNNSRLSWSLEGNYVVGDELGNSGGSRIIPILVIPESFVSMGYCLSAVRTASPLKFYSVIDYDIFTRSMSTICWSVSYNPAIQDIIQVLESLTSDQVDPSPRIGFWDKVRFMIHTQTKFNFIGGGDLAIVVKGTRDPYQLQGRGAGLAKIWSDNVIWLLGYKNAENEFMQILSKNYSFGVPDLIGGGYVPSLPDSLEKKKPVNLGKFLKVALKLSDGIRMGIGLHYERQKYCQDCTNCSSSHHLDRCRTQEFFPHYKVLYQSVQQVKENYDERYYDAFYGFRSDFIHLSLSIVHGGSPDSDDISQNAMYISPCFIEHFSHWYKLLGSPVSIPIRQGKLFPRTEAKSKSFGEHLNTIKYKFVINPLVIGFFCTDEESYLNVKGGGSAGLKATVHAFSVDLHQRREVIVETTAVKTAMIFHEVEVELHDIDLRVIKMSQVSKTNESSSEATSIDDDEKSSGFQWADAKDYVILDSVPQVQENNSRHTNIEVHPFAFSPLFYYVKQEDEAGTEKREYLRETHDCIMEKGMDSHEFQKSHLQRRASDLDETIENHDQQLDLVLNALTIVKHAQDKQALHNQYNILLEKLNYLRTNRYMLHTYLAQLILETELNMNENRGSPQTTTSSLGRRDELSRWEMLMGHFKDRFFIHNPQIIWNNSVRDAIYYWQDIKNNRSVQDYNLSSRCLKFLEDLVHTAEKQQQWKPDVPSTNLFTDDHVTQELIEKLLSERSHNYVAYNEKEEEKTQQDYDGIHVFDCVNDPDYQYKNIPESYEMKSKYLIDMMNPQVNFQSEKGLDHLILFTNERIHVKAFSIIDNSSSGAADKDVRLVKDRIIVSLDNAELLVAKRMEFLSTDLFTQSSYGQCRNLHWTAWVQPEQLWYYKDIKYFDNFQRVASQLCGTIQLDRYNHLRIKINKYNTSRKSPFEDRTNTLQLHFPQFKLTLNSQQGHILYYTLTNLLLGNDGSPRKKERSNRFRDVMLAAERSDLAETVKQVGVLQNQSRILLDLHKRFLQELPGLDSLGFREFNKNRKKMRENLEKLYLVVEAIRSIQTFRRDIHLEETDNAMRFSFTSDEIVWEAVLEDQSSLCKWILINTKYVFLDKQNGSSKNTIEVDKMQLVNTTNSPVFTNVLDAYIEPGQDQSRQKMLRGVLESLPPVGGIPVIQQLEINLVPLHLQISTAFGTAMKDYFFPPIVGDNEVNTNEEQQDESDEYDDAMSVIDGLKVNSQSSSKIDLSSLDNPVDKTYSSTMSKREGSFASFDLLTQKVKASVRGKRKSKSDELTVMKNRSSTNRTFIYVRIPATRHCLSLQGPTQKTFYNLYNFPFKQPKLEYRNKTWSIAEMMEEIQKQFIRAIVRHSPALLKNKLLMSNNKQPVTSISNEVPSQSIRSTNSIIDLTDDSPQNNTNQSSYNTEEEDEKYDFKSLYSIDFEEELQRLAELQTIDKRMSFNVDQELLDIYLKRYRQEEQLDEKIQKGRILFGDNYNGSYIAEL